MDSLLVRALRGEPVPRPPVWLMRQAGRYLPEYRALRAEHSFLDLCYDAALATEVTLQPMRRFGLDAAIVFSDILLPIACMGRQLEYRPGPYFADPIRDPAGVDSLGDFDPVRDLPATLETVRRCAQALDEPVIGFAGAPFTLACYLVQGQGSSDWGEVKRFLWAHPEAFEALLDRLAGVVGAHLQAQVDAGASAVLLFDTWAGALTSADYRRFALTAARRALAAVRGAPSVYYTRDSGPFLPWLRETGADGVGLDWRVDLGWARQVLGPDVAVQGNLDPTAMTASADVLAAQVEAVIRSAGPRGHVFNLGHGCGPGTPIEGVQVVVDTVRAWDWSRADL